MNRITPASRTRIALLFLAAAALPVPGYAQGPNTWTKGTPMPTAVQGAATGLINGKVYVISGVTNSAALTTNQIYDPQADTWTTGAPIPTPRAGPASGVVNNIFYVIGGKLNGNQLNVVEAYDPSTDTWSTNYAPLPAARDSIKAVVSDGIIYVIGGFNNGGDRLNSVDSYDPSTNTWTKLPSLLVSKSSLAPGVLGSTIVAANGLEDSGATGDNEGYSLSSGAWEALKPDPTPRWDTCSAVISGQLYIAGGRNNSAAVNVTESYNLASNQWDTLAPIPVAVNNAGETEVNNLLYCFGGSSTGNVGGSTVVYNDVQIYHPAVAGQPPAVSAHGVVSASSFGGFTSIAPGSWIEIYGSNLAADTQVWSGADFMGASAPTSLDGTVVSIGGQSAFIDYISPGQVNAQVPSTVGTGAQHLVVSTGTGTSSAYAITVNTVEPGLLAPASFDIGGTQYIGALFPDGTTFVLPQGAISGVTSRPAKPGDTIVLYGVGFGTVTPNIPAGQIVGEANMLTSGFSLAIDGVPATVNYFGLAPGFVGLYQFNFVMPDVLNNNAAPVTFSLGGKPGVQSLHIAVDNGSGSALFNLSSGWSIASNPNGPWVYNEGTSALPLVHSWNGGNTTWSANCSQPAWAPSNSGGNFLPAWMELNSCAATYFPKDSANSSLGNVLAGDVVVHTNDDLNGNTSKGPANLVFTLPASAPSGVYAITGALWDARLNKAGIRPQDWTLLLNGAEVASGTLSGTVPRSQAKTFSSTQTLKAGDQIGLEIAKDPAAGAGDLVGVQLAIASQ